MNFKLYLKLIDQYIESVTYAHFQKNIGWVKRHIERLCTEFPFLEEGELVKHTIGGTTRVSKVRRFFISTNYAGSFVGIDTGYGNIWYYEAQKPTQKEIEEFDGHCLVVGE